MDSRRTAAIPLVIWTLTMSAEIFTSLSLLPLSLTSRCTSCRELSTRQQSHYALQGPAKDMHGAPRCCDQRLVCMGAQAPQTHGPGCTWCMRHRARTESDRLVRTCTLADSAVCLNSKLATHAAGCGAHR